MNAYKMWNRCFTKDYILSVYEDKVKNSSSVGLDKISAKSFSNIHKEEIEIILRKAKNQTYQFTRYKQILFSKGEGKAPRVVCVPTIRDKLTATVINDILIGVYGDCCKTRQPQLIINDIRNNLSNYEVYIKIDISSFYSSIDHSLMIKQLHKKIRKSELIALITNAIETEALPLPIKEKREKRIREKGLPEGLPMSNALANIYMLPLDNKMSSQSEIKYFRYVDDILVLLNISDLAAVHSDIKAVIRKLKLSINDDKIEMGEISKSFSYLGYRINENEITVKQSGVYKFENSIEELLRNVREDNIKYIEWKLNLKITGFILDDSKYGWLFFYSQITEKSILHHLDWLIEKLLVRYGLKKKIKVKRFVRTYYEITRALHETKYIPNINSFSIEQKKELIEEIYKEKLDDKSDETIERLFRKIMKREIRDIERDMEHIS